MIQNCLNPKECQKFYLWFKTYGHFIEGVDFAFTVSFMGKGLRLQPAQHACFYSKFFFAEFWPIFKKVKKWISHCILKL